MKVNREYVCWKGTFLLDEVIQLNPSKTATLGTRGVATFQGNNGSDISIPINIMIPAPIPIFMTEVLGFGYRM